MKFIKKHYKLFISILVCLLVFVIFKENNKNNQNYLSLGDGFALGKDSYGQVDYGYSDYLKDYLQENEYLNRYIKSFSEETMSIAELKSKIIVNKRINIGNQEINLKQALRESTILTLSIGLNDLIYQISIADNLTDNKLDKIITNIEKNFNSLIIELKKYYQYDIYVIGYYNINSTNYFLTTVGKVSSCSAVEPSTALDRSPTTETSTEGLLEEPARQDETQPLKKGKSDVLRISISSSEDEPTQAGLRYVTFTRP